MTKHEFMQKFRNNSKAFEIISGATSVLLAWDMENSEELISLNDIFEFYQALKDIQESINRTCVEFSCVSELTFKLEKRHEEV